MDTKWKNRKKVISFLIFFLGISITLGSIAELFRNKPSGVRIWQIDKLLEQDYQESGRFRAYIANRLETLLIMATGGNGLGGFWGYLDGTYYGGGYDGNYYYGDFMGDVVEEYADSGSLPLSLGDLRSWLSELEYLLDSYGELMSDMEKMEPDSSAIALYREDMEEYESIIRDYLDDIEDYLSENEASDSYREDIKPLTEEQKAKIAQKYHDNMKDDKNLLYTVAYEGKVLYSNSDALPADGSMTAPEGYNFILYFDGEKVRILKDGKELDVYGDGYYREGSDWYVPGYANFQLDETTKKTAVCIAAAKTPVLYTKGSYCSGGSIQYDNSLYWMNNNLQARRSLLLSAFWGLGTGILILLAAFLCRKSRREAAASLARIQAKIWFEVKLLLFFAMLYLLYAIQHASAQYYYGYNVWEEFYHSYESGYGLDAILRACYQALNAAVFPFWLLLFWGVYLIWNDIRHNRKIWRHGLTAKLYRTFCAKSLQQPLSRKMARRNALLFHSTLLFGLLMLIILLPGLSGYKMSKALLFGAALLSLLSTVFFLILQYLAASKNMEAARDMEALACRISEIRSGDYRESRKGNGIDALPHGFSDGGSNTSAGSRSDDSSEALTGNRSEGDSDTSAEKRSDNDSCFSGKKLSCDDVSTFTGHDLEDAMAQLEDIRHGMAKAVEEQMKSERMKVELIANVSHDIKTPLTSIISYVEFLKQEEDLPEHVRDYIRILDEKSHRLKNMVQDVFAVSKAASGELPMQMEVLDFGKLLRQTMADMEEQINGSEVTFRTEFPAEPVKILADGQRMYRVFQNLFQNAIKYSLNGSRVYVTLKTDGRLAMASVKNTSRLEPEQGKDFAERFVRGDQSRTDGGSGLGLSIAQSFTEACGGSFSWEVDADLFIVRISFQIQ